MALSYKTRRRLSVLVLLVGLPAYIVTAVTVMNFFFPATERPPIYIELFIYIALGVLWAFPLKAVFKGVGRADPDQPDS